jgi:sugar lactone lactonase YvrE
LFIVESTSEFTIDHNTVWLQNGFTVAGGNGKDDGLNQLNSPHGMYVDDDQTIYIADYANGRIVEWKRGATTGQVVAGGNGKGNKMNQLNCPTDVIVDKEKNYLIICDCDNRRVVRWPRRNGTNGQTIISNIDCHRLAMDNDGYLYVSDWEKSEVRRWRMDNTCGGTLVAGGNRKGNRLDQLDWPTSIFVDEHHSVYVSDRNNHRVMKWTEGTKEGIVVAGGQEGGNSLKQLSDPQGVFVDRLGTVYVVDRDNHRIVRWFKGATQGNIVVGGNGEGGKENQLNYPTDLSVDRQGNLYVVDHQNHRVQRFNIDRNWSR